MSQATAHAAYLAGQITTALAGEIQRDTIRVTHDDHGCTLLFKSRGLPIIVRVEAGT